ncbi:cold shock-like protein CspF [Entomohabitans teleogrylli]|uniref:cold shock-like protein CspF n=1 Tax=Entomohabitans teleogrylli TaxID=1384589 RepID=UPI00073D3F3B|nr:cold shock-like protein CspF [Entomohabitans teleogrylli]
MSQKMTGIVKVFNLKNGKGFITPSDGRKDVLFHTSTMSPADAQELMPGMCVEFRRMNGLKGPTAANVYLR